MVEAEAEGGGLHPRDTAADSSIEFSLTIPAFGTVLSWLTSGGIGEAVGRTGIMPVLVAGLVFRLVLATLPGFGVDMGTFAAWANQLADTGPWNFYDTDFFTDYAPGYLYVLWFIGEMNERFHFGPDTYQYVLKLPSIAADVGSAYLLYRLLEDQKEEVRVSAAALYLLIPITWFTGAVWGQVDSLLAFFVLLSIYFINRRQPVSGAVAYAVAFLVKPQAIAALPFLAFWVLREYPPRVWALAAAAGAVTGLVLIFPFFGLKPWDLYDQLRFSADVYKYASFHAYNFWAAWPIEAYIKPDSVKYLGLTYQAWGFILFAVNIGIVLYVLRKGEGLAALSLGTSLSILVFYMFITRMHERYVFAFFLPFLVACVLYNNRVLWASFAGLALLHLLNLYHAYAEFNDNELRSDRIFNWLQDQDFWGLGITTVELLSLLVFLILPPLVWAAYALVNRPRPAEVT